MKFLNDKSASGVERWTVASKAFEHHDPTRRFANLNPMVQEHWLAITDAVLHVLLPSRWRKYGQITHQAQPKVRVIL